MRFGKAAEGKQKHASDGRLKVTDASKAREMWQIQLLAAGPAEIRKLRLGRLRAQSRL